MTQDEQERDLNELRTYLSITNLTADRSRHETVTHTSLWVFLGRAQIASISRTGIDNPAFRWRASLMAVGVLVGQKHFETIPECIAYVTQNTKGAGKRQSAE